MDSAGVFDHIVPRVGGPVVPGSIKSGYGRVTAFLRRQGRLWQPGQNLLLVPPRAGRRDGRHGTAVSMLPQPAIDGRSKGYDEGARPRLETEGLEFQGAHPGVPERVLGRIDVDIRGAVLVDKGQTLAVIVR